MALTVNAVVTVRLFMRGWTYGSGYLAHAGIAVMVLGMVLSSSLGKNERLRLPQGEVVSAMGYTLTYQGEELDARGEQMLKIRVEKPGFSLDARPRLFPSPQGEGLIRKPEIANRGELYLSPVDVRPAEVNPEGTTWLAKGEEVEVAGAAYTLSGFRMTSSEKDFTVFADISVRKDGHISKVSPALTMGPGGRRAADAVVDGLGRLSVAKIDADGGRVAMLLPGSTVKPALALMDLSTKPLINLVWIGALLAILGSIMAGFRRAVEGATARGRASRSAPARLATTASSAAHRP
jgi:cytochrome c-type biogenesis protein CcmF